MRRLRFVQIEKGIDRHFDEFKSLMLPYFAEIDSHFPETEAIPEKTIIEYTRGMINMQGPHDRHLELCYDGDTLIGFHYAKVDHEGHKGFIKLEYGYIMEFYVIPQCRRKGYGREMFHRLEALFAGHGTKRMYLTADRVTGVPFWKSLGFEFTGEISPENKQDIYEKDVAPLAESPNNIIMQENTIPGMFSAEELKEEYLVHIADLMDEPSIIEALHIKKHTFNDWKEAYKCWETEEFEKNFIVFKGSAPVCWLKLNGFESKDMAWISMLVVGSRFQRTGVGTFAVRFAEEYIKSKGINKVGIHTTGDNIAAQSLYKKCGYGVTGYRDCTTDDGEYGKEYTFEKKLE